MDMILVPPSVLFWALNEITNVRTSHFRTVLIVNVMCLLLQLSSLSCSSSNIWQRSVTEHRAVGSCDYWRKQNTVSLPKENVVYEAIKMTLQSVLLSALKVDMEHKFRAVEIYTVGKDSLHSFLH